MTERREDGRVCHLEEVGAGWLVYEGETAARGRRRRRTAVRGTL